MVSFSTLIAFALVSLGMVCSPGPNMVYLISRSITQGRMAGFISLLGIMLSFLGTPGKDLRLMAVIGKGDDDDITKLNLEDMDNEMDYNETLSDNKKRPR